MALSHYPEDYPCYSTRPHPAEQNSAASGGATGGVVGGVAVSVRDNVRTM